MAALDLQCGMWVGDRPEFDPEMLEWEEQLQDMQRKIEELYNEVVARRGGNDGALQTQASDITLLPVANQDAGCYGNSNGSRQVGMGLPAPHAKGCGYQLNNGYGYGDNYPGNAEIDPALEILQGYLGQGKSQRNKETTQRTASAKQKSVCQADSQRLACSRPADRRREEVENRRNQCVYYEKPQGGGDYFDQRTAPVPAPVARPPTRHHDGSPLAPTQQPLPKLSSSPPDRKPAPLDRKQGSPSVLRKFGAMLQENEGKVLTDTGVVAPSPPPSVIPNCSPLTTRRSQTHVRTQSMSSAQSYQHPHTHNAHTHTQAYSPQQTNAHSRSSDPSPTPATAATTHSHPSPKMAHSHSQGQSQGQQHRAGQWGAPSGSRAAVQGADPGADYWMVEHILNGPMVGHRRRSSSSSGCYGHGCSREEGVLVERLNTPDVHQQQPLPPASRVSHTPPMSRESSPASVRRSFSRPARPANQRPPSRWASQSGHCIRSKQVSLSHSGPVLSRPPSPSPARKARPANQSQAFGSYSLLHTETVIM